MLCHQLRSSTAPQRFIAAPSSSSERAGEQDLRRHRGRLEMDVLHLRTFPAGTTRRIWSLRVVSQPALFDLMVRGALYDVSLTF